jgi:hypothetical protein
MWIFPGSDVHVVRTLPAPSFRVVVQENSARNAPWQDASTIDGLEVAFTEQDPDPAGVTHTLAMLVGSPSSPLDPLAPGPPQAVTVAPSATSGTSMFIASATTPEMRSANQGDWFDRGVLRVTTHDDVTALFAGDNGIHMFADESNRVVAVYARFSDGGIAEVTGHSWLVAASGNLAVATVDSECRIMAVAPGSTTITVSLSDGRFPVSVAITVLPSLASGFGATVLRDQLLPKTARHNTTLYVLSEGYTDHTRFYSHAWRLIDEWSKTSPFKELRERFAAFGIFIAAPAGGITIGSGLAPPGPGDPIAAHTAWRWKEVGEPPHPLPLPDTFLRTRDTLLGVMFGARWNPPSAPRVLPSPPPPATRTTLVKSYFAGRTDPRTLGVDDRRLPRFGVDLPVGSASPTSFEPVPPEIAYSSFLRRYIEAAGYTVGPRDRVVILVDDDYYGGLHINVIGRRLEGLPAVALSVGRHPYIDSVTGSAPLFDRTPPLPIVTPDVQQRVGATLAHELAHSYQLGDEYQEPGAGDAASFNEESFELFENVQHVKTLRRAGAPPIPIRGFPNANPPIPPTLDTDRIKWNVVHRIVKASQALSIAEVGTRFRLVLERHDARRWVVGERVYLRSHSLPWLRTKPATAPRYHLFSTEIAAVDVAADTVDLEVPAIPIGIDIADYTPTPVLYVPKTGNLLAPLSLIDPAVLAVLAVNGPFVKARPCQDDNADGGMNLDEQPIPNPQTTRIPDFNYPAVRARTIGLYEGAAHWACSVFRPAGRCKMRRSEDNDGQGNYRAIEFCFVCQYTLVDLIDPSKHPEIDKNYPGGIR